MSSQPPPPSDPFGPPPASPGQPAPPFPGPPTQPFPTPGPTLPPATPPQPAAGFPPSAPTEGFGGFGPPPAGPGTGGPGGGGPFGPGPSEPSSSGGGSKKGLLWIAIGAVVAVAIGAGVYVALSGGDDEAADDTVETVSEDTEADTTVAPETTAAPTTAESTTTAAPTTTTPLTLPTTVPPPTTEALPEGTIDLGNGVTFQLPDGYSVDPDVGVDSKAVQISDGTNQAFFQVLLREAGESPLVLLQEYIDTFDSSFDTVSYSQVIPADVDSSGQAPADSNLVYYRAVNADGSGVKGVIDANRRADGLAYVSDVFVPIDTDTSTNTPFPSETINEVYGNFLDAPLVGDPVDLSPLSFTRVSTVHPILTVDGLVAFTPPADWVVDSPGPGRVIVRSGDGQIFEAEKLATPITDEAGAVAAGQAAVVGFVPDATFGDFTTTTYDDSPWFSSAGWRGTNPSTGQPLIGYISVWFDPNTGEAYASIEAWVGPNEDPPHLTESNFMFNTLDTSISQRRS